MFNDVLIDHTSIHSVFSKSPARKIDSFRVRELLKIIEALLLPNNIWVANLVSQHTWNITDDRFFSYLNDNGLSNPIDTGNVKSASFPHKNIMDICLSAAPNVYQIVSQWKYDHAISTADYQIRPEGASALNFIELSSLPCGTDESMEYVEKYIDAGGWGNTASLFLIHDDLNSWLRTLVQNFPDPEHNIYKILNVISRWQLNESTALAIASELNGQVEYLPAYGRGVSIENSISESWRISNEKLLGSISKELWHDEAVRRSISQFVPTSTSPFPMYGLWVLSQLPEDCDINRLLSTVAGLREHSFVNQFHTWNGIDDSEIDAISNEVLEELMKASVAKRKHARNSSIEAGADFKVPILHPFIEFVVSARMPLDPDFDILTLLRRKVLMKKQSTVIIELIEDSLLDNKLAKTLLIKAESILNSIK